MVEAFYSPMIWRSKTQDLNTNNIRDKEYIDIELDIEFEDIKLRTWLGNADSCNLDLKKEDWKQCFQLITEQQFVELVKNGAFWLVEKTAFNPQKWLNCKF